MHFFKKKAFTKLTKWKNGLSFFPLIPNWTVCANTINNLATIKIHTYLPHKKPLLFPLYFKVIWSCFNASLNFKWLKYLLLFFFICNDVGCSLSFRMDKCFDYRLARKSRAYTYNDGNINCIHCFVGFCQGKNDYP